MKRVVYSRGSRREVIEQDNIAISREGDRKARNRVEKNLRSRREKSSI